MSSQIIRLNNRIQLQACDNASLLTCNNASASIVFNQLKLRIKFKVIRITEINRKFLIFPEKPEWLSPN